MIIQQNLWT